MYLEKGQIRGIFSMENVQTVFDEHSGGTVQRNILEKHLRMTLQKNTSEEHKAIIHITNIIGQGQNDFSLCPIF